MTEERKLPAVTDQPGDSRTPSDDSIQHWKGDASDDVRTSRSTLAFNEGFGKQLFLICAGISLLIFALIFAWGFFTGGFFDRGSQTPAIRAIQPPSSGVDVATIRGAQRDIVIGASDTQHGVTVELHRLSSRSRHINLEIRITNHSHEPVSFMGLMTSQLVDDRGRVYPVDFSTADGFITVNPGASASGLLRFTEPLYNDAKSLTLVINDVGTLKNRWYHEITFGI